MRSYHLFTSSVYIRDILEDVTAALPASTWAVIRCLDSIRAPAALRLILERHGVVSSAGNFPVVRLSQLSSLQLSSPHQILTHFDELWMFPTRPLQFEVDSIEAMLTSDAVDLDECPEWDGLSVVAAAGPILAIGDGDFANVVVRDDAWCTLPHSLRGSE